MSDFKSWPEIKQYKRSLFVEITEKIHGSNAQILIDNQTIMAGSRTRWLSPGKETDNYGFAAWVSASASELREKLGDGRHYGEWYGQGINNGYGLTEKRFALFNTKFADQPLPNRVDVVPVLYKGPYKDILVDEAMESLKSQGSKLVAGFMKPEGVVINFPAFGHSVKHVFEEEETGWRPATKPKGSSTTVLVDVALVHQRLQPIRLEKLLSSDSQFLEGFPNSLGAIAQAYIADLEKENQFAGADEATIKAIRKAVWPWIKEMLK